MTDPRLVAAILRNDLYSFIQAIFPIASPNDSFTPNWHLEAIAYHLSLVRQGKLNRLIITVPPRSLKSICASVAFPAFLLGHNPRHRIICVSYSEALARKHATDCRAVMRSNLYGRLFPDTRLSPEKNTEVEFATTLGGGRLATSVGGTLTGRGGDTITIDDPMRAQDAESESARENTNQWYGNTLLSRLDNKTTGAIIVVMQRLHVDDLVGHLLPQGGWTHLNLPAIAQVEEGIPLSETRFHRRRPGDLLHPAREPREILDAAREAMGTLAFGAQYLQEPVPEGGNHIKWSWFHLYDNLRHRVPEDKIIVSWDTAQSSKDLASYSVCVVLRVRGETVHVLDVIRQRLEYPDLKRRIIEVHKCWRYQANSYDLAIENKGSGMCLIQDLQREGVHAVAIEPEGDKVMRMTRHTPRLEAGCVFLPRQAPWLDEFRREILAFPAGRYNDQVDAFSQALDRVYNKRDGEFSTGYVTGMN
jgi:predicted phage terminase large subunit-like protein